MKKLILPLVSLFALTGCHVKPELRKDIKEFLEQFSLKAAMEQYRAGGYTSRVEKIDKEKKVTTVEYIEMEFSYLDALHPSYYKKTTNYRDEKITKVEEVEFVEIEEKYYISTNGELKESSLSECSDLITKFFFTIVKLDGEYHTGGWYYGDYLKEVAAVFQSYVTIDQENELYIMDYSVKQTQSGVTTDYHQTYSVNKFGMLAENHVLSTNETKSTQTDIYVHN